MLLKLWARAELQRGCGTMRNIIANDSSYVVSKFENSRCSVTAQVFLGTFRLSTRPLLEIINFRLASLPKDNWAEGKLGKKTW